MDFTVIVPSYNRPVELAGCLQSLAAQDYPSTRYEIIVVDDGGSVDLSTPLRAGGLSADVTLVRQESNRGAAAARNSGMHAARGRWLAFTDDDCRPHAGWLHALATALDGQRDVLAGGSTSNVLHENVYSATSQAVVDAAYAYFNRDPLRGRFVASNNFGTWRDELRGIGGFDERFRVASEDRELCDRWCASGRRIVWTAAAQVSHRHELSLAKFLCQHFAYGRGAARYHRVRRVRGTGRLWDDLAFRFQWRNLLLRPALASARPATMLALLACWQAANTAGFVAETARNAVRPG